MKNRKIIASAAAIFLCMVVSVGTAVAYFTDYENGRGGAEVNLSGQTRLIENMQDNNKVISVQNTGETDMIVRVLIFGDESRMTVKPGSGWIKGEDGAFYYNKILKAGKDGAAGESTSEIIAEVTVKEGEEPTDFDIMVVNEGSRVVYDGQGDPTSGNQNLKAPDGWDADAVSEIDTAGE